MPTELDLIGRLALATVLAGVIGAERELSDQPAGFRTHALVGLGTALFTIVSAYGFQAIVGEGPTTTVRADPTRVASNIVTGIGFLGGGAILKYGASVRGLTTAATLWTTAAIGMAVGVGEYWTALAVTAIALVALVGLRPVRRILRRHAVNTGELVVEAREQVPLAEVLGDVERHGANVTSLRIDDRSDGYLIHVFAKLSPGASPAELAGEIAGRPYATSVDWRST